jgi:acetyl-CoA acetyltransferase
MSGITSYGAYIPFWRLSRDAIAKAWGRASLGGERSVANNDEDTVTMAVEATLDSLSGMDRQAIDGLYFASTSEPFREKQCATLVAAASDLNTEIITADFSNSLRSGTTALHAALDAVNSGSAHDVVVVASDIRLAYPRSDYEQNFGDAAAALLPHSRPGFDWLTFESLERSSQQAYQQAGIKNPREELDIAEVHDCFTITELAIYENFGFSKKGRAKEDIDSGFFELSGGLPVNADGGLKCFGHPVGASGLRMIYEVYKQMQGKAQLPERQLKNVRLGLGMAHTFGGPPQVSAVAIVGADVG